MKHAKKIAFLHKGNMTMQTAKKTNHKSTILKKLYDTQLKLTATDFHASNANQYLGELEAQDLITREKVKRDKMSSYKVAYITKEQKPKVEKYLSINVIDDESQVS